MVAEAAAEVGDVVAHPLQPGQPPPPRPPPRPLKNQLRLLMPRCRAKRTVYPKLESQNWM